MTTDLEAILPLWRELSASGTEYVLATIVAVEGSGYRKPGARMLISADGRRSGTISGGCLEAEVAKKAFWHTQEGPVVRRYSTSSEDGDVPFGMGCGGIVHLLLERSATAASLLERLATDFTDRRPVAVATVLEGEWIGLRRYWPADCSHEAENPILDRLTELARQAASEQRSMTRSLHAEDGQVFDISVLWQGSRPGLFVFGAGDDAVPLVKFARQLGWYVTVADRRSHLVTQIRFPDAHRVLVLAADELPALEIRPTDAAVILTHNMEQDGYILSCLIGIDLTYIGVLGPRRRTSEMLMTIAQSMSLPMDKIEHQIERWMERLHAPMGLDLGGNTPADIALAVVAEIQQCLCDKSGLPLRTIRNRAFRENTINESIA